MCMLFVCFAVEVGKLLPARHDELMSLQELMKRPLIVGIGALIAWVGIGARFHLDKLGDIGKPKVQNELLLSIAIKRLNTKAILRIPNGEALRVSFVKHPANSAQNALAAVLSHRSLTAPP